MKHICIIAEAGVNHNGNFELAKKMVKAAKEAGADYIKFQTFIPEKLVSRYAEKAAYQKKATGNEDSQLKMLEKLTLTNKNFYQLKVYCDEIGIGFISTPFDLESMAFLEKFNMDFWKVPSGEVTNLPYLEAIAKTKRKVLLSTGMCSMDDINAAVNVLESNGCLDITLLHCNTQYPTPYEHVNLLAMNAIKNETGKKIGYSDHTQGIEVPIAAVAMGATVIEKHFTLDKKMEGPDHQASLEPYELKEMVLAIRNIEKAFGDGIKQPSASEKENMHVARKSIVAATDIKEGDVFTVDTLAIKRPGNGISPMKWYDVVGKRAIRDFKKDELIEI